MVKMKYLSMLHTYIRVQVHGLKISVTFPATKRPAGVAPDANPWMKHGSEKSTVVLKPRVEMSLEVQHIGIF